MHILFLGTGMASEFARLYPSIRVSVLHWREVTVEGCEVYVVEDAECGQSWESLVMAIHMVDPVDSIVAFGEREQVVVDICRKALNDSSTNAPGVATSVCNKAVVREMVPGAGVANHQIVADATSLARLLSERKSAWVVKPIMGTGAEGVSYAESPEGASNLFLKAFNASIPFCGVRGVMVERLIRGRQFCIEAVSVGGTHYLVGLTEQFTYFRGFAAAGYCTPASVNDSEWRVIANCVVNMLNALRVTWGPTHTELILEPGPRANILETHTRLSGHLVPEAIHIATGVDLRAVVCDLIAGRIGCVRTALERSAPLGKGETPYVAAWFGYSPHEGRFGGVDRPPVGTDVELLLLKQPGDQVGGGLDRTSRVLMSRAIRGSGLDAVGAAKCAIDESTLRLEVSPQIADLVTYM